MTVFALMWTDDTSPAWMLIWAVVLVATIYGCYRGLQSLPGWIAAHEDLDKLHTEPVTTPEEQTKRLDQIKKQRSALEGATALLASRRINVLFIVTVLASMFFGSLLDHIH